ncbi:preprotein translocase subunit SecE [Metamycoplasma buccale]|uniref:preprotein translocase subunit SecE n=1 Tax=Metamycoplasma buccale TaxID=55602 RepID=UPI00398E718F
MEKDTNFNVKESNEKKEIKESTIKNFVKEVKRIKWPKSSKTWRWFGITIAFLVGFAIFCFLVTFAFTSLWNSIGIKS